MKNIYHVNVNVNLMVKNAIQIKIGTMANGNVIAKKICAKKAALGILLNEVVKMVDSIVNDSVITRDEIIKPRKGIITKFVSAKKYSKIS